LEFLVVLAEQVTARALHQEHFDLLAFEFFPIERALGLRRKQSGVRQDVERRRAGTGLKQAPPPIVMVVHGYPPPSFAEANHTRPLALGIMSRRHWEWANDQRVATRSAARFAGAWRGAARQSVSRHPGRAGGRPRAAGLPRGCALLRHGAALRTRTV